MNARLEQGGAIKKHKEEGGKLADKPGFVVDSHSSRRAIAHALKQPTRERREPRHRSPIWSCSGWRLPRFTSIAAYRDLLVSVALFLASRRTAVSRHPALRSPDFPLPVETGSDCLASFPAAILPRSATPLRSTGGTPARTLPHRCGFRLKCATMTENIVEIDNLSFSYNNRLLHQGINMRFPRGKVVAIMGGSGSGKTTLLRLIGGQLKPKTGLVRVAGKVVHELDETGIYQMRRKMGMLFQFGALFTDLSVFDNVAFPMREHTDLPEPIIRDLVLLKLNAVGLRGARDLMPSELSGGMARRVALARAVALDPSIIMYDEPFAGLDPISMGVILNLIRRLNDALGATSIVVTHDVHETFAMVDYIYFVSAGVVVAEGTPDELRESQLPFVHQFVHGEADGPVPFHYAAPDFRQDLLHA
jgi:phospholipid/cholesterol/gamma-HCH transport system ATP-binding protein